MVKKYASAQFVAGALTALALVVFLVRWVSPVWASPAGPHGRSAPAAPANFDGQPPFMVPAAAFRPDGNTSTHYYFEFGGEGFPGGYVHGTDAANKACLFAPVYLPEGAIIDRVMTSVVDNDATPDWSLQFSRLSVTSDTVQPLADIHTTSHGTAMQNPGASLTANNVVPSQYYAYYLTTCVGTNERFYNARVYYNVRQMFTPLINK